MKLRAPTGEVLSYKILQLFPFTSESKRMGIIVQVRKIVMKIVVDYFMGVELLVVEFITQSLLIVVIIFQLIINHQFIILQDEQTGERVFYMKGADVVMSSIVQYNDWLEEEVGGNGNSYSFSTYLNMYPKDTKRPGCFLVYCPKSYRVSPHFEDLAFVTFIFGIPQSPNVVNVRSGISARFAAARQEESGRH